MTHHGPIRYLFVAKYRPKLILTAAAAGTLVSALIGLLSPYLYTSSTVLQFEPKPSTSIVFRDDSVAFHKSAMLLRSTQVVERVAQTLGDEPLDPYFYFPKSIPLTDVRTRLSLFLRHLRLDRPDREGSVLTKLPLNVIVNHLQRHLRVSTDSGALTLTVSYEAGDPLVAQKIARLISEAFVEMNLEMEKGELRRQESYIEDAIARQLENIRSAEREMRGLVEEHPSMAAAEGEKGSVMGPAAQRYMKKQERLEKIEEELSSNTRLLAALDSEVGGTSSLQSEVTGSIAQKVTEELSELEFRRLNSVKFGGYTEDHPSIYKLDQRIKELKEVLSNMGLSRSLSSGRRSQSEIKNAFQQAASLREKNRALRAEKEVLLKSLVEEDSRFRRAVQVNFDYESIGRTLKSSIDIVTELHRDLQKVRLTLSGMAGSVSVVAPASFQPYSVNLSIQRRLFFSIFVNLTIVLSLILLWEILRPSLLVPDDLRALALTHLGRFRHGPRGYLELASRIWSLGERRERHGVDARIPRVVSLLRFIPTLPATEYYLRLGAAARRENTQVAVVLLRGHDEREPTVPEGITFRAVARDEALLSLPNLIAELKEHHGLILVGDTEALTEPIETLLAGVSDHFVYLTQYGATDLASLGRTRHLPELPPNLRHHAAVIDPPEGVKEGPFQWRGPWDFRRETPQPLT